VRDGERERKGEKGRERSVDSESGMGGREKERLA